MHVPRIRTAPTRAQWLIAIDRAWQAVVDGGSAPLHALAILYGQLAIEAGRDPQSGAAGYHCWCWNLGNVRWTANAGTDYCTLDGATEFDKDGVEHITGGAFRAYPTLEEGAVGFLRFLQSQYSAAFSKLTTPLPEPNLLRARAIEYVHTIKTHGYFTGPEDRYANVVAGVASGFSWELRVELEQRARHMREVAETLAPIDSTPTDPQTPQGISSAPTARPSTLLPNVDDVPGVDRGGTLPEGAVTTLRATEGEHTPAGVADFDNDPFPGSQPTDQDKES